MAVLVGRDTLTRGLVFPLDAATTIGREPGATLRLAYDGISRQHARINPSEAGSTITDLGSTNGTAVNGVDIREHALRTGDRIQLGSIELEFKLVTENGLAETRLRADAQVRLMQLSDRELEVAQQVAQGLRSTEIAEQMNISTRTVNTHLEHIYDRLGLRTRPALAGLVARAGSNES